jgi:molecular chaperone GrpE
MSERQEEESRIVDRRASTLPETDTEAAPLAGSPEALARQLAEEQEKAQAYLANWQRAAADFQNYKRRVEQEREDFARLASAALIINVLPILDDLERALQGVDSHLAGLTWVDGIRLIHRKFHAVLEMAGVKEIEAGGADFDPNVHEAVAFGDGEDGKVISVVQKGYMLNNRVLRPSMVVVGRAKDPEA